MRSNDGGQGYTRVQKKNGKIVRLQLHNSGLSERQQRDSFLSFHQGTGWEITQEVVRKLLVKYWESTQCIHSCPNTRYVFEKHEFSTTGNESNA